MLFEAPGIVYFIGAELSTKPCCNAWAAARAHDTSLRPATPGRRCLDTELKRQPLGNGWEEALHFFPEVRDRLAIAREMAQQASLEESIKQRIEGAPGDDRLSATK